MSNVPRIADRTTALQESADDLVAAIGKLLDSGELVAAQRTAARAAEHFADHPWLRRANEVLNPGRTAVQPARDPSRDRRAELDWLYQHSKAYRGKWVALFEGRLLASAETFAELLAAVPAPDLEAHPLIHHIG